MVSTKYEIKYKVSDFYLIFLLHIYPEFSLSRKFVVLFQFYAPWCAHCKRLEPIWAHVAQALTNTNVRVGKVDCTRFTSLATEFKVNGFPTIML